VPTLIRDSRRINPVEKSLTKNIKNRMDSDCYQQPVRDSYMHTAFVRCRNVLFLQMCKIFFKT